MGLQLLKLDFSRLRDQEDYSLLGFPFGRTDARDSANRLNTSVEHSSRLRAPFRIKNAEALPLPDILKELAALEDSERQAVTSAKSGSSRRRICRRSSGQTLVILLNSC